MLEGKNIKLIKVAKEFNVGIPTIVDFLKKKGIEIDSNPNTKITDEAFSLLVKEYSTDSNIKKESKELSLRNKEKRESLALDMESYKKEPSQDVEDTIQIKDFSGKSNEIHVKVIGKTELESEAKKKAATEKETKEKQAKDKKTEEKQVEKKKTEKKTAAEKKKEEKTAQKIIEEIPTEKIELEEPKVLGKIDLDSINQKTRPAKKTRKEKDQERKEKEKEKEKARRLAKELKKKKRSKEEAEDLKAEIDSEVEQEADAIQSANLDDIGIKEDNVFHTVVEKLSGPTVLGRMDLPVKEDKKPPVIPLPGDEKNKEFRKKKKRKRIKKDKEEFVSLDPKFEEKVHEGGVKKKKFFERRDKKRIYKIEVDEEEVDKQMKETLSIMSSKTKSKTSKYRKEKREEASQKLQEEIERQEAEKNILKVTEFVTVNELASMMNVPATQIIATCMNLGLFVSINQRLDAETMALVAEEFGFKIEFVSIEALKDIVEEEDKPEDLVFRPPIVTVMGHVDHGKTKLLDFIRNTNVVAGEAGGITQHIGAYHVTLEGGKKITFLDTPGHEAFTAMRARGAQVTDIAIIVIAADDNVMPQTIEAINHAQAAGVPIVFAINKIDKPTANPEKIKEELAKMNLLVEDWGGKYQCQEIAAKPGLNVNLLLEKILLEAEMLDLKANPAKRAVGTVIESSLDKGRGYVATVLVKAGTLKIGDILLAGSYSGHIKAMYNERGQKITEAGPSVPAMILGLNGAPQAGDPFNVMESEREAREIANKREQLQREQGLRTQKHITLDEIGRRLAIGNFKEINLIVKGDVDGSIEALSDSLIKLSNEEIQVSVIHKAVGQISESDVMLASASNAVIVGFQVRPSVAARKLAEREQIEIRLYSIIYDAIEELKAAMEGMLSPELKEDVIGTAEIKEVFKITKVGSIAGCLVLDGKINRHVKVRVIREGIVIYTGELGSLKRFKDDAKEVSAGLECGLNIDKYNDIKAGDLVEAFTISEVKKKLN
ncbi:MAG: translation initiation factor IF-2 [Bacteroidia bacterium]|nr:translation initiation factor IF-2 [Bacteroidia bacterium]